MYAYPFKMAKKFLGKAACCALKDLHCFSSFFFFLQDEFYFLEFYEGNRL